MPGSSLWLVPPEDSALHKTLATLITSFIPGIYPIAIPPRFSPHITLTADTAPSTSDPQDWLDNLELPQSVNDPTVQIKEAQVGEVFFRKLTFRCEKVAALKELAGSCRKAGTGKGEEEVRAWVEGSYGPHASLMYSDLPQDEIHSKMDEVTTTIDKAKGEAQGALSAKGAEIWLVPTYKDIDDWQPVARRKLQGVQWSWE